MPRKSSKKGGAFAYAEQYNFPLSPCYKPLDKAQVPRLGWHAGGGSNTCLDIKSVSDMGIVDKPFCSKPSASEIAWVNRFTDPGRNVIQDGGAKRKIFNKLNTYFNSSKKSNLSIDANKNGKEQIINIVNSNDKYVISVIDKNSNKSYFFETKSQNKILEKLNKFNLLKINKSKKTN